MFSQSLVNNNGNTNSRLTTWQIVNLLKITFNMLRRNTWRKFVGTPLLPQNYSYLIGARGGGGGTVTSCGARVHYEISASFSPRTKINYRISQIMPFRAFKLQFFYESYILIWQTVLIIFMSPAPDQVGSVHTISETLMLWLYFKVIIKTLSLNTRLMF